MLNSVRARWRVRSVSFATVGVLALLMPPATRVYLACGFTVSVAATAGRVLLDGAERGVPIVGGAEGV